MMGGVDRARVQRCRRSLLEDLLRCRVCSRQNSMRPTEQGPPGESPAASRSGRPGSRWLSWLLTMLRSWRLASAGLVIFAVKVIFPNLPIYGGEGGDSYTKLFETSVLRLVAGVCLLLAAFFVLPAYRRWWIAVGGTDQEVGRGPQRPGDRFSKELSQRQVFILVAALLAVGVLFQPGGALFLPVVTALTHHHASTSRPLDVLGKAERVKEGIKILQVGLDSWAADHDRTYPPERLVRSDGGPAEYLSRWPANAYTGEPMQSSPRPGDFTYTVSPDGKDFTLTGHITGQPDFVVP